MHSSRLATQQNPSAAAATAAAQVRSAADAARQVAADARAQAAQARGDAAAARAEADAARQGAETQGAETRDPNSEPQYTVLRNGNPVLIDGGVDQVLATIGVPRDNGSSQGPFFVAGIGIIATAVCVLVAVTMWYRTRMRGGNHGASMPAELTQRMSRMENAIESVAVEVERISEGQRFTTRLLTDRVVEEVPRA
jgi:hypothetical protein